jgi:hypothetical protein
MAQIGLSIGFIPIIIILIICILKFVGIPVKKIAIDHNYLYISNYLKTVKVPLSQIMDVTENKWANIHPVWIHLYTTTDFGDKIMFIPETRILSYKNHPIVQELKKLSIKKS